MDRLDVAILGELFRDPRAAYADVAGRVGLSANAVAARVKRLHETGVLQGFAAAPRPALLGMREGVLVFTNVDDLDERERDILASLPDVPGVRFVDVAHDRALHVSLCYRDDADWERIERAAVSLLGKPPALALRGEAGADTPLTIADWRLVRAMLDDGRAPLKEVAKRSGLSFKTVKRRLASLLRAGHLRVEPVLSPSEATGLVLFTLSVVPREGATVADLLALLPPDAVAQTHEGSPVVLLHVARSTLREAQEDHRKLKASGSVERVLFAVATRRRADAWLDDAVGARIDALARPAAPAPVVVPVPRGK